MSDIPDGWPRVSIIIPTWNEATTIALCLKDLIGQAYHEVIVVDCGSPDDTAAIALATGVRVVQSRRGRGTQQNAGAAAAAGDVFLFLHADCRLERGAVAAVSRFMSRNPRVRFGCLRMKVASERRGFRLIDSAAHLRAGLLGVPYGDQAVFVTRPAFASVGGFPDTRLMEDVLIALKLRNGGRVGLLPYHVLVSPRRWDRNGLVRQTLLNWSLTLLAALGVSPNRLADWYQAIR